MKDNGLKGALLYMTRVTNELIFLHVLYIANAKMFIFVKLYPEGRFTQLVSETKEVSSSHS